VAYYHIHRNFSRRSRTEHELASNRDQAMHCQKQLHSKRVVRNLNHKVTFRN